ncbi:MULTISPECIES: single-stranded-DNA-specific exonuclease RecJ [Legionella]|uniref:Single-stranded-DNA-specific exonuclease RecJ n=1 Tax=Legionella septentrionalis TaxID=2498109 RepID=A0A3S0XU08_9GAMM|nr:MULTISPECIES: single-stranded-DNA-specific exonuclease RecJ [Legionella]MCP0913486.1 single-stranded-DNA-specific exonuclease RecJ [Legionella sp. 27cVA30]RUQ89738.1 single-stranded-DNA-specific exonuclease RecJ [Legionella septentrionalis]RUQ99717.1 single-stranded-DNA-specific exonuclease RecJ [Legionella septentrionalis]RUR11089.1 single-stranded-DNA-specific exonuclease RecJ [Legionella septentrionalis]RUR15251.1 single-stranded-DNA-specific exonuclease RecJ [Legionella septentrionalis]
MLIKRRVLPSYASSLVNIHPVLQRVYAARGIMNEEHLDKRLNALLPFHTLTDIDKAATRLEQALRQQQRILIIGDFDADGATSSALAVSALRSMGAQHVDFLVPNRFEFGYGLTAAIVEVAKKWHPDLIITVDNGIASIDGVAAANAAGINVLITDHHLPAESLPEACAIVNPNQAGDRFPSKTIAGVGVIFYVMLALRRQLSNSNWFGSMGLPEPNMAQFLDLVALGTVADVVALDQNNRIMVNQGLMRIRQGLCRPGMQALIEISGRKCRQLRENDLGFAIAPRLNAAGRLDDMSLGIECLLCEDFEKARMLALHLDELNVERRKIEAEMKDQALAALDKLSGQVTGNERQLPVALCLFDPTWHQGVIGILAGRLKERYHRPAIAFAAVSEQEMKGSARSIPGLNIRDVLAAVDKDYPDLIIKFGGHAMAAGLSINPNNFSKFEQAVLKEVSKHIDLSHCYGEILSDGPLEVQDLSLKLACMLQEAGPWGQQFPEPVFDNVFEILEQRLVGQHHLKLTLVHEQGNEPLDAIAFNVDLNTWPNHRARKIHAAYKLDINEYGGRTKLQLVLSCLQAVEAPAFA